MNKHTPGPWSTHARLSGSENHRGFAVSCKEGWGLAFVQPGDPDGRVGEANARLIAAAPDLLEAAMPLTRYNYKPTREETDRLRAAIAKATG